jgi:hypothetical protein
VARRCWENRVSGRDRSSWARLREAATIPTTLSRRYLTSPNEHRRHAPLGGECSASLRRSGARLAAVCPTRRPRGGPGLRRTPPLRSSEHACHANWHGQRRRVGPALVTAVLRSNVETRRWLPGGAELCPRVRSRTPTYVSTWRPSLEVTWRNSSGQLSRVAGAGGCQVYPHLPTSRQAAV